MTQQTTITGSFELPGKRGPGARAACTVAPGTKLTEAAEAAGILLNVACGGKGSCGGCAMDLVEGEFLDDQENRIVLNGSAKRVLACHVTVQTGPFLARVPRHSIVSAGEKVLVDFERLAAWKLSPTVSKIFLKLPKPSLHDQAGDVERILIALREHGYDHDTAVSLSALRDAPLACREGRYEVTATLALQGNRWHLILIQSGDTTGRLYAMAVDIGTTTVVCALIDLRTGDIVDAASSYNQQIRRCDDVASRISYATTPQRLLELQRLVVDSTINPLARLLMTRHGLGPADVPRMAVSANNIMTHLFLGADPTHLGGVPFQSASNFPQSYTAAELGVVMHPAGLVDVIPAAAAYIGGDITSDMYVCGLHETDKLTLLVDIGTNAEIAIGNRDRVIACAAPAGPAFEGQGLACGMRASVGAIDTISIDTADARCSYSVIGDVPPSGICGSGLIDFLAEAFNAGVLTAAGRFDQACERVRRQLISTKDAYGSNALAYVIVPAEETDDKLAPIVITEADVARLLQAKGVIFAAIQIAMKRLGKKCDDIEQAYLAGGFARHLNLRNAVTLGLLPDIPIERYRFIGNGSLAGAYLNLVDQNVSSVLPHVAGRPDVIELNLDPDFQDAYTCAMFLPNIQADLFPSVKRNGL